MADEQMACGNCVSYREGRCLFHAPVPLTAADVAVAKRRGLNIDDERPLWPKVAEDNWCRQWEKKL